MKRILIALAALLYAVAAPAQNKTEMKKIDKLVVYFSCTGTTKGVATKLAQYIGADLFEITPATPYTAADLDWRNKQSRSSIEMNDPASRPAIAGKVPHMEQYKTVYIGYPIWWYVAPTIINTFIESHDFSGKTVIPFATSGSSDIENSEKALQKKYPNITWKAGKLLNGAVDETRFSGWVAK